jgi:arabinose-5-phosphate isomerase
LIQHSSSRIREIALQTIETEAGAILNLGNFINDNFVSSVNCILSSEGRVIVTGVGKSAIIAGKIVATLNSTGTPALYMHAGDAVHGDLGMIQKDDAVICISQSGNTAEIQVLIPFLRQSKNKLIGMTGNPDSYLARNSDFILNTSVVKEACPNNLAPTSSSVAQMAMGDALAVCLLDCRGFSPEDFARFHPGGSLGKKLYLKVKDIYPMNEKPFVGLEADLTEIIIEISSKRLGATAVLDNGVLAGIITDGDLRRMLMAHGGLTGIKSSDIMTRNPKSVEPDDLAVHALQLMKDHNITQLVVSTNQEYHGFIHLHDLIREGIL